jgi:hypothetical protein
MRQRQRDHRSPEPLQQGTVSLFLRECAERRDEIAVRHSARAHRLASQTTEARIDVRQRVIDRQRPLKGLLHQHNPPAGRIHLLPHLLVGRAGCEAKAAVNASLHSRSHGLTEGTVRFWLDRVEHVFLESADIASPAKQKGEPAFASPPFVNGFRSGF